MPNSVLEAMACALPCLVSDSAGVEASVVSHGVTGFALDVESQSAFADTLYTLLTDARLRERIGTAARQAIMERFSLDVVARRYWDLYRELLGLGPAAAVVPGREPPDGRGHRAEMR